MAITYNTVPQKKFYLYSGTTDKVIYGILTSKPSLDQLRSGGGYFYCYNEETWYDPDGKAKAAGTVALSSAVNYVSLGWKKLVGKEKVAVTSDDIHGYVEKLPHITVTETAESTSVVYYLDTMISVGDKFNGSGTNVNFERTADQDTSTDDASYATLLKDNVIKSLSTSAWKKSVNNLPVFLRPAQTGFTITSCLVNSGTDYSTTEAEMGLFGTLFTKSLMNELKALGDEIVAKNEVAEGDTYTGLTLTISGDTKNVLTATSTTSAS